MGRRSASRDAERGEPAHLSVIDALPAVSTSYVKQTSGMTRLPRLAWAQALSAFARE
ncbi:MAG: hypothetical protein KAJ63_15595 [Methyloprofundus sp.]|nr:hypothetical protein [Methyloprofundus sp.]